MRTELLQGPPKVSRGWVSFQGPDLVTLPSGEIKAIVKPLPAYNSPEFDSKTMGLECPPKTRNRKIGEPWSDWK